MTSATIERVVAGGWGLTHVGSLATFVRGTLPGEQVTLLQGEVQHGYQIATLESVDTSSPDRIASACPKFGVCGGCQFQHVKYDAQLQQKTDIVREAFARIGHVGALDLMPVVPSPFPYEYRRWVRFAVFSQDNGFHLGFRQERSHQLISGTECLLIPEALRLVVEQVETRLARVSTLPMPLSNIEIRSSASFGNHLLIFRGKVFKKEQTQALLELFQDIPTVTGRVVASFVADSRWQRQPLRVVQGEEYLFERFADLVFRISDRSFMQANWAVYEMIQQTLLNWIGGCTQLRILELFAGVGCLGLSLARQGALVTEVEGNAVAVADARKSASINHIGRCRFRPVTAERYLMEVGQDDYDVIIVDPPRTGLSKDCTKSLVSLQVPRLFYLSCDAPSLARDVKRLCDGGYRLGRVQIFDMFPQTAHVETLVELLAAS
ncbi:MAG: 23S rRNA (uracil(1939)-C(5))-methyltransferase RlmD [Nitrospirota bacterium]|nr:23S rRNA (uracil(1939)-C(5))-methyltransferase RlmD [Nitrospirota bacterium]